MIIVGVDPHKRVHTATAVDAALWSVHLAGVGARAAFGGPDGIRTCVGAEVADCLGEAGVRCRRVARDRRPARW